MKLLEKTVFILILLSCFAAGLMAQKPADLVGTWLGEADFGLAEPHELTLVLKLKEGKLSGHMTDQYGTMENAPIENIKLEEGVFSFSVQGKGPEGETITLFFKMNVEGSSMKGTLEIPDMGLSGSWEATKI